MDTYLFQVLIYISVLFAQIQSEATDTSTASSSTIVISTLNTGASASSTMVTSISASSALSSSTMVTSTLNRGASASSTMVTIVSDSKTLSSSTVFSPISDSSISSTMITTELTSSSVSHSPSIGTVPSSASYLTSAVTSGSAVSTVTHGTENISFISSRYTASMVISSSGDRFSSSSTSTSLPNITSTLSTPSPSTNIRLLYRYIVESSSPLKIGNITDSAVLASVQNMVRSSFNLSNFIITVTRIEIQARAKSTYENYMITDNLFRSNRNDCNAVCINNGALSTKPTQSFTIYDINGALVNVNAQSGPTSVDDMSGVTSTPINYKKGESPPGIAAQLGMGFGISIISILLIGEIIYFYRKYGLTKSTRQSTYELPSYNNRLSV